MTRPAGAELSAIAQRLRLEAPEQRTPWEEVVGRSRAAATLPRLETATLDAALVADASLSAGDNSWPADYVEAFERLGHAERYGTGIDAGLHGLTHPFDQLSEVQLGGLTSSIKGTVMEIRVREMIDAGELPEFDTSGVHARLSDSLNQTGHDIEVFSPDGDVVSQVQVKAGTWADVRPRIEEYQAQGIPIAVTSETAAAAEAGGFGDAVIDTGISAADITAETADLVDNLGLGHAIDEFIPEFAVVALVAAAGLRLRKGQDANEVKSWLTGQLKERGVANAAGVAVQLLTGAALLRPVAVMGARWGMERGRTAEEAYVDLQRSRQRLGAVARRADGAQGRE